MPRMYRQGDVLIIEDPHPRLDGLVPSLNNILVYGEATGHAHRIEDSLTVLVMDSPRNFKEIIAKTPFSLVHDEHNTIVIPEGHYRVIRQREYDEREIRYVRD